MAYGNTTDLLGDVDPKPAADRDIYAPAYAQPAYAAPGATVDLSGASSIYATSNSASPNSFTPGSSGARDRGPSSLGSSGSGGGGSYSGGGLGNNGGAQYSYDGPRGPTSIEGGSGEGLSLAGLNPANIMRQLASKPVSELVVENGRNLLNIPRYAARAYSAAAKKYLRPWSEFGRLRPGRIIEGLRGAQRRGEIQVHMQRNVLANARDFCPNYAAIFLAMLFMFVCSSPLSICMLGGVGGGWSHAMRSDSFRNRPWQLQLGNISVPLGSNMKMLVMSLPTLVFLHFFMGPILWSAALCSGGVSAAHAALRDRDDDADPDDHGLGGSNPHV